jgi:hypothetical protein
MTCPLRRRLSAWESRGRYLEPKTRDTRRADQDTLGRKLIPKRNVSGKGGANVVAKSTLPGQGGEKHGATFARVVRLIGPEKSYGDGTIRVQVPELLGT